MKEWVEDRLKLKTLYSFDRKSAYVYVSHLFLAITELITNMIIALCNLPLCFQTCICVRHTYMSRCYCHTYMSWWWQTVFRHIFNNCLTLNVLNVTSKLFYSSGVTAPLSSFYQFIFSMFFVIACNALVMLLAVSAVTYELYISRCYCLSLLIHLFFKFNFVKDLYAIWLS